MGSGPAVGDQQGFGEEHSTLQRFLQLFPKHTHFRRTFWSKFLLKNMILSYCTVH